MARIGTDIEQISRVARVMVRTERFAEKIFTVAERAYCDAKPQPAEHYAARFCAKEAFAKAVGQPLSWHDVEILRGESGPPALRAYGKAAQLLDNRPVHVSLSHAGDYAIAVVLIEE